MLGLIARPPHGRSRGGDAAEWGFGAALAETRPQAGRARVVPWGRPGGLMPERRLALPATTSLDADRPGVLRAPRGVVDTHIRPRPRRPHLRLSGWCSPTRLAILYFVFDLLSYISFYSAITVDMQRYIKFACTTQRLGVSIRQAELTLVNPVPP